MRVLIVEDEALVAMLLADYLEELGHEVTATAASVADALVAIADAPPDLAIVDCALSEGEASWPVADQLAEQSVPFLFSSGSSRAELPAAHADAPMLLKPYTLNALQVALTDLSA